MGNRKFPRSASFSPKVPLIDIRAAFLELESVLAPEIQRVTQSGHYILGEEVEAFEDAWSSFCGTEYTIGCGNGYDALVLTLMASGIGPGDEVVVPAQTFIATWLAVSAVGATVIPVDVNPDDALLTPSAIESAISSRTSAVIVVDLYGRIGRWAEVEAICDRAGVALIEDAAQSHGASKDGRRAGSFGSAGCFSFYPAKNLGALGDGGAITCKDQDLARRIKEIRNYGMNRARDPKVIGINSRLDALQAAILRVKIPYLDSWNRRRIRVSERYRDQLGGLKKVQQLEPVEIATESANHLQVVKVANRDELRAVLAVAGIETGIHYRTPPHLTRAYEAMGFQRGQFPAAEELSAQGLSLPMGPHLSLSSVDQVVDSLSGSISSVNDRC